MPKFLSQRSLGQILVLASRDFAAYLSGNGNRHGFRSAARRKFELSMCLVSYVCRAYVQRSLPDTLTAIDLALLLSNSLCTTITHTEQSTA